MLLLHYKSDLQELESYSFHRTGQTPILPHLLQLTFDNSSLTMRDKLPKFLRPTNDMRKAIDRDAKQDKDLLIFTKQLDKEKKMVI